MQTNTNDYSNNYIYRIATVILLGISIILSVVLITVIISNNKKKAPVSSDADIEATISDEDNERIKNEAREEILSDIKTHFSDGGGPISLLKNLFPDNIVYVSSEGDYVFAEIDNSLKKNARASENYQTDSNGFITY